MNGQYRELKETFTKMRLNRKDDSKIQFQLDIILLNCIVCLKQFN